MTKRASIDYRGYTLDYQPDADKWHGGPDGMPGGYGTLAEVMEAIDRWEVECQKLAGAPVWVIEHSNPKYWAKWDAVFRKTEWDAVFRKTGGGRVMPTHYVMLRNGNDRDPNSLWSQPRGEIAMDTPEALAAIEEAKAAFEAACDANERWKQAKRRIPTMTEEQWLALPERSTP